MMSMKNKIYLRILMNELVLKCVNLIILISQQEFFYILRYDYIL